MDVAGLKEAVKKVADQAVEEADYDRLEAELLQQFSIKPPEEVKEKPAEIGEQSPVGEAGKENEKDKNKEKEAEHAKA